MVLAIRISSHRPANALVATVKTEQVNDGANTQQPYTTVITTTRLAATDSLKTEQMSPEIRPTPTADGPQAVSDWISEWMKSAEAHSYAGEWVAITPDNIVHAHGPSPADINDQVGMLKGRAIIYVLPTGIRLA